MKKFEPNNYESLLLDTEALLKRWKEAASIMVGENLQDGQKVINHLFAANAAFSEITDMLDGKGYLPEKMKQLDFF
jgi:hypothetical protein